MTEDERFEHFDLPFYKEKITPILPSRVLDFHIHSWTRDQWIMPPTAAEVAGAKYMVTEIYYPIEQLRSDAKYIFPDQKYNIIVFGHPSPSVDITKTNLYIAQANRYPGIYWD